MLLSIKLVLLLTAPLLVALLEIDETLSNGISTIWKWEENLRISYISCWFFRNLYTWDPAISWQSKKLGKFWTSNLTYNWLMPLEIGKDPNQHWYCFEYHEFKPVFLSCPWTIESPIEQLEVTITGIHFTLHRQFRLRLQVHPTGEPLFNKFIKLTRFHEHFASAVAAIQKYYDFPELGFPDSDLTIIESLVTDTVVNQYT